jgi:hypothetical protein
MTMRIFKLAFLIMVVVAVNTTAYGRGGFIPNINFTFTPIPLIPIGTQPRTLQTPNGFWFKPDADREQLQQDYRECRGKGERSCMREKGYFWLTPGTGFWYKIGTTQKQVEEDYSDCKNTEREISCMKGKGYTFASYYGE